MLNQPVQPVRELNRLGDCIPQEELPDEFVKVVTDFVNSELLGKPAPATASDSAV